MILIKSYGCKEKYNNKIKVGIIGCGRISENHIKSIYIHNKLCDLVHEIMTQQNKPGKMVINNCQKIRNYFFQITNI